MYQTFYPGVYFKEVEFAGGARPIQGVDMSIGACIGYFEKGPIGVPTLVNASNYGDIFGGPIADGYGWYVLDGFFKNNPSGQCWVVRVAHYNDITDPTSVIAVAARGTIKDDTSPTPVVAIDVEAIEAGKFAEKIGITVTPTNTVNTILTKAAATGATSIKVRSTNSMKVGMNILVGDEKHTIVAFDAASRVVTLGEEITTADTGVAADAAVKSIDFTMTISYKGNVETFEGLSMDPNLDTYFEYVVNDENTGSQYIRAYTADTAAEFPACPTTNGVPVYMTGGDNGLTGVSDTDLMGNMSAKTGIYAFSMVTDSINLFCAESCSEEVTRAILTYCESRMDAFAILSVPEGLGIDAALSYRLETGNFNSSYGALYFGWGYVSDPIGNGSSPQKLVPLVGHIAGYYGRNDYKYDIGQVPAGEDAVLQGVNKLEQMISDIDNGNLNKNNINAIRSLTGAGIVIWGARTLSTDTSWRYINARRIFIYCEKSIMLGTRWVVFKPSNPSTWKSIQRTVESFLNTVPGLYGDTPSERYAVICDETTNPESVRKAGQIVCKIGLAVASVGEFLIFEIGQMSEGTSLTE